MRFKCFNSIRMTLLFYITYSSYLIVNLLAKNILDINGYDEQCKTLFLVT